MYCQSLTADLIARYLRVLGIPRKEPSRDALTDLVDAHVKRVPFENISKLYYRKHLGLRSVPGLELFLEGIERYNFGGTCYTTNYYLNLLLAHLGYEVRLCGADMANPDVHIVSMVTMDGREYLVDVGYAAPFLAPLPRDLTQDHVIALGRDRYVLKPQDEEGRSRLQFFRNGHLKHGYVAKPTARPIEYFNSVVVDSFTDHATFMNALLVVRFLSSNRSHVIHNLELIESHGTESRINRIDNRVELVRVVERHFGIPRTIVAEALADLGQFQDAWN
jgi:N-hydroxyarylamine O-acetyltransferase